jgi:tetratricopeptide (TPR) repeat protein
MASRLRDEHRRLDELRAGDMAVRASFQVSFTSLPASVQPGAVAPAGAFRLLGLWHGPSISSAAAAALFGTPEDLAEDALEVLVDAHLLESTASGRYKFHDLLRVYASERAVADLPEAERQAAVARLLGWYMRTADAAGAAVSPRSRYNMPLDDGNRDAPPLVFSAAQQALAWYDSERANVLAATRQAATAGRHDIAWRLPVPLFLVFDSRGAWADCIASHRVALDSARQAGNRRGEAWVLNNLGLALGATRDSEGITCLERSLALRHEIGDQAGEAQAAGNLADTYTRVGRPEEAIELFGRARDLNRVVGNRYGEGVAQVNLGDALLDLGRAEEAVGPLEQARTTFAEIPYLDGVGYACYNLGRCYRFLHRDQEALDALQRALDSHQASGSRHRQAVTLRALGAVQAGNGLAAEGRHSWTEAAAIFDELGDKIHADQVRADLAGG